MFIDTEGNGDYQGAAGRRERRVCCWTDHTVSVFKAEKVLETGFTTTGIY